MTEQNDSLLEQYRDNFEREVEEQVAQGEWVKMCNECGACSGSCPLADDWQYGPHKLIALIRAGERDAVLQTDSMWMCTSCYHCVVRCPRGIPVTALINGLAHYASQLGQVQKAQPTHRFAEKFWENLARNGRINEAALGLGLGYQNGLASGLKNTPEMLRTGTRMAQAKRLSSWQLAFPKGVKDKAGLKKILAKAQQLEDKRRKG